MLLTVDIGNTNIAFGVFDKKGNLKSSFRIETRHSRTLDEYHPNIQSCLAFDKIKESKIKDVIVSSVVPQIRYEFTEYCKKYLGINPLFVNDKISHLHIDIELEKPEEVGCDRLVNSISAREKNLNTNVIIVDFGTATTFDVVSNSGNYIGGIICPGVNLSVSALQKAASKLPEVSIAKPQRAIGVDTKSAMQSGIYNGYMGLIENNLKQIKSELEGDVKIIATGGLANFFYNDGELYEIEENLTLEGLQIIYQNLKHREKI